MPSYATQADFEAYVEGWVTDDPAALARLLERASRDIDYLLGSWPVATTGDYAGLKLDPTTLLDFEGEALSRAACAQGEHLFLVGQARAADTASSGTPARTREKGPDFEVQYAATATVLSLVAGGDQTYGPKVRQELAPITHLRQLAGRAAS